MEFSFASCIFLHVVLKVAALRCVVFLSFSRIVSSRYSGVCGE